MLAFNENKEIHGLISGALDQEFVVRPDVNAAVANLSEAEANVAADFHTQPPQQQTGRLLLPILLFVATCLSTWISVGPAYSLAVMTILLAHEMGHYIQTRRYGVPASLPYFIPCRSHSWERWEQ